MAWCLCSVQRVARPSARTSSRQVSFRRVIADHLFRLRPGAAPICRESAVFWVISLLGLRVSLVSHRGVISPPLTHANHEFEHGGLTHRWRSRRERWFNWPPASFRGVGCGHSFRERRLHFKRGCWVGKWAEGWGMVCLKLKSAHAFSEAAFVACFRWFSPRSTAFSPFSLLVQPDQLEPLDARVLQA